MIFWFIIGAVVIYFVVRAATTASINAARRDEARMNAMFALADLERKKQEAQRAQGQESQ